MNTVRKFVAQLPNARVLELIRDIENLNDTGSLNNQAYMHDALRSFYAINTMRPQMQAQFQTQFCLEAYRAAWIRNLAVPIDQHEQFQKQKT